MAVAREGAREREEERDKERENERERERETIKNFFRIIFRREKYILLSNVFINSIIFQPEGDFFFPTTFSNQDGVADLTTDQVMTSKKMIKKVFSPQKNILPGS